MPAETIERHADRVINAVKPVLESVTEIFSLSKWSVEVVEVEHAATLRRTDCTDAIVIIKDRPAAPVAILSVSAERTSKKVVEECGRDLAHVL